VPLDANTGVPLFELKSAVLKTLHQFSGKELNHDDLTLIALEICYRLGLWIPPTNRKLFSIADINNKKQISCTLIFCRYCKLIKVFSGPKKVVISSKKYDIHK
jgi:hypothetical protein